ncbi:hypothetical protein CASFOL_027737 [Castilleja foliolosa]|uniref:Uncharacterized protein n=1 Tax=Castilleja foliolosa TaxID=1961234 RepID=A0ABD3CI81_9LAMI
MAFLLNKTAFSTLRLRSQKADGSIILPRRGFRDELGAQDKALNDAAIKSYEAYKKHVRRVMRGLNVLPVAIGAGGCYGIYVVVEELRKVEAMREEGRREKSDC